MSMAITHFAVGVICATIIVSYLLPEVKYPRTLIFASGLWAILPDFHQITPVFEAQFRSIHDSTLANLFWFHQLFDLADYHDSHWLAAVMLGALIFVTLAAEIRLSKHH